MFKKISFSFIRFFFSFLSYVFFTFFCKGKFYDNELIEKHLDNGFILAANHVSYIDGFLLFSLFKYKYGIHLTFLSKERMFRNPFWRIILTSIGSIKVSDDGERILDRKALKKLSRAKYIAIFPEGTRSPTGAIGEFKTGAIMLAKRFKLVLIPVALKGVYDVWPRNQLLPLPKACSIILGNRFDISKFSTPLDASHHLKHTVSDLLIKSS